MACTPLLTAPNDCQVLIVWQKVSAVDLKHTQGMLYAGVQLPHVPAGFGSRSHASLRPTLHHRKAPGTVQPVLVSLHGTSPCAEVPLHRHSASTATWPAASRA